MLDDLAISRRGVLVGGAATATLTSGAAANAKPGLPQSEKTSTARVAPIVNGHRRELEVDTRTTPLDALREHLHLTGTKQARDHGQRGVCTMMVGGIRINACLSLAVLHEGDEITTIEGLGTPEKLHPMQAAHVKHDGYQCGYYTPGQICSAVPPKPWRVPAADAAMSQGAKAVALRLLAGAKPTSDNSFKVPLVERTLAAVMAEARA